MMERRATPWHTLGGVLLLLATGCGAPEAPPTKGDAEPLLEGGAGPWSFPMVDDNIVHDTLLVQTTFDLGDGTFVMVAGNVEDTFEGLRLVRYRPTNDSSAERLAISSPAYDSWTMLPTFFPLDTAAPGRAMWVLANFGERESWGQKLFLLDGGFTDMGFMDVALPERVMEDDTPVLKRRNVAPHMRYHQQGDTAEWYFACDSVYLYDDQAGGLDRIMAGHRIRFTHHPETGLSIWIDGEARPMAGAS